MSAARVLHVLPHRGGGAETYLDLLGRLEGVVHARAPLATARTPRAAGPSIAFRWPRVARAAGAADLVHAHGDVAAALALPLLRARPSVWTTHGLHALRRAGGAPGMAIRAAVRATVAATAVTLCCSAAERDELLPLVPARLHDRLRVVPNGVDLPAPAAGRGGARAGLGLDDDDVAALFLGELEPRKGPLTAAGAARRVGAPLVLLVAGDGPQRADVEALAGPQVRVLGFREDVDRLLVAADAFVLPSEREGISFAVLEAMAHGLAMVVSDGAGNPEAVGPAGLVTPVGDEAALAEALAGLVADAPRRAALGAAARERVRDLFGVERLLDGVREAYVAAGLSTVSTAR